MTSNSAIETQVACGLLRQYNCLDAKPQLTASDRTQLQQALQIVIQASDYQILGICADTLSTGRQALLDYAAILGYQLDPNLEAIEGAVYIKFNPKTGLCYASPYFGSHRGVLVSCQSAYESGLNEMFGHLPLDLFMSARSEPSGQVQELNQ